MAALSAIHPTLLDVTKRLDPGGKVDNIVEILAQTNDVLEDMVMIEANNITSHVTTTRSGLPDVTWRKLYGGVQPSKSRTLQVTDTIGMLEAYAEIDKKLAAINGNTAAFRMSEDIAFVEAMGQEVASKLFYGNELTNAEQFTGLASRFSSRSAENGSNIICSANPPDGSDNTSIWLIVWGANTVHGIYPKGSKAGWSIDDLGERTSDNIDGNNGKAQVLTTHYAWDFGLSVRDWRYVVRIQIDQEDLTKNAATGPDLVDLMAQALEVVPSLSNGRPVFYCNRNVRSFLRRQIANKTLNSTLSMENIAGKHVVMFDGIPVRRCDALLNTEAAVS